MTWMMPISTSSTNTTSSCTHARIGSVSQHASTHACTNARGQQASKHASTHAVSQQASKPAPAITALLYGSDEREGDSSARSSLCRKSRQHSSAGSVSCRAARTHARTHLSAHVEVVEVRPHQHHGHEPAGAQSGSQHRYTRARSGGAAAGLTGRWPPRRGTARTPPPCRTWLTARTSGRAGSRRGQAGVRRPMRGWSDAGGSHILTSCTLRWARGGARRSVARAQALRVRAGGGASVANARVLRWAALCSAACSAAVRCCGAAVPRKGRRLSSSHTNTISSG